METKVGGNEWDMRNQLKDHENYENYFFAKFFKKKITTSSPVCFYLLIIFVNLANFEMLSHLNDLELCGLFLN